MDFERYLSFISQPVIITDRLFQVITLNPAFAGLFPKIERGETVKAFFDDYPALALLFTCGAGGQRFEYGDKIFTAHVSFVYYKGRKAPAARCTLLADITETVKLLHEAEGLNGPLREYNEQARVQNEDLEQRIAMKEQAAAIHETSILLRDLHDTLGHSLTIIKALQSLALDALPDEESARAELRESLRYTDISIAELQSVGGGSREGGLTAFFNRFRDAMKHVGLDVALDVQGEEAPAHLYMYVDISRICQEAATNSIRHGSATRLEVTCQFGNDGVALRIKDNGSSLEPFQKGNGLIGMGERVHNLFGDIEMEKVADGGFEIAITVPVIIAE